MFFWRGKGLYALLFMFASFFITTLFGRFILRVENDFSGSRWFLFSTCNLAAFFCWKVGNRINSKPPKILIDPKTNEEVQIIERHTFWFIPLQYWGIIYSLIGIYAFIKGDL